jgi:hypothetical protein
MNTSNRPNSHSYHLNQFLHYIVAMGPKVHLTPDLHASGCNHTSDYELCNFSAFPMAFHGEQMNHHLK